MAPLNNLRWRFSRRAGYRGVFLLILALGFALYGTGMEIGYRPTVAKVYGWPIDVIGLLFIGSGLLVATGAITKSDQWHYAFAAFVAAAWSAILSVVWAAPVGWGAAVSWMIVAMASLVAAGWPNPTHRTIPDAKLDDLDNLRALIEKAGQYTQDGE